MSVRIIDVREITKPIASPIRNAYIDFTKMTTSLVAVVTDVVREGKRVVGYGFNSNGRYGQGGLIRERFRPRVLEAEPQSLIDEQRDNLDPHKVWAAMMINEKPGGHGERSVAVGTIDMAVWDAVAKIEGKPLYQLLAERHGDGKPNRRVFVYAAGGYYWPGQGIEGLEREMRSYLDRGYSVVVVDDGSADETWSVIQELPVHGLRHLINLGQGAAACGPIAARSALTPSAAGAPAPSIGRGTASPSSPRSRRS